MKFFELALLTGQNPATIEDEWDVTDVNMCLLVKKAQENARIAIAARHKTEVANIAAPTSIEIRG